MGHALLPAGSPWRYVDAHDCTHASSVGVVTTTRTGGTRAETAAIGQITAGPTAAAAGLDATDRAESARTRMQP